MLFHVDLKKGTAAKTCCLIIRERGGKSSWKTHLHCRKHNIISGLKGKCETPCYVHFKETSRLFSYTWADGQAHTQPVIGGNFVSVSALAYRLARVAPLSQRMLLQWWNHWRPERAAKKTNSWCFCATLGPDSSGSKYSLRWDRPSNMKKRKVKRDGLRRNEKRERVHPRRCLHKHKLLTQSISPAGWFPPRCCPGWWMRGIGLRGLVTLVRCDRSHW